MPYTPNDPPGSPAGGATLAQKCLDLHQAKNRGDLGECIALLVLEQSPVEIQRMKQNFSNRSRTLRRNTGNGSQNRSPNTCGEPISGYAFFSNRVSFNNA
jgi:hypothetical protein